MKPIPNHPNYLADEDGNIFTVNRRFGNKGRGKGKTLSEPRLMPTIPHRSYGDDRARVQIDNKFRYVAQLILETFVGPRPRGHEACHGPLGCTNDSLANIYWATPQRNQGPDKVRDGTTNRGERQGSHKLNSLQVRIIRRAYVLGHDVGVSQYYLARVFGVRQTAISLIILRQRWNHIP